MPIIINYKLYSTIAVAFSAELEILSYILWCLQIILHCFHRKYITDLIHILSVTYQFFLQMFILQNIYPSSCGPAELVAPLRNISNDTGPVALRGLR